MQFTGKPQLIIFVNVWQVTNPAGIHGSIHGYSVLDFNATVLGSNPVQFQPTAFVRRLRAAEL